MNYKEILYVCIIVGILAIGFFVESLVDNEIQDKSISKTIEITYVDGYVEQIDFIHVIEYSRKKGYEESKIVLNNSCLFMKTRWKINNLEICGVRKFKYSSKHSNNRTEIN